MTEPTEQSVTASLQFDFRGETFRPSIRVDIDRMMQREGDISTLYDMLAASIGMDRYRHEYDVMILEPIRFSDPVGLIANFIHDGALDFDAFADAWQQQRVLGLLRPIAAARFGIEDLDQHPALRDALLESYRAGLAAARSRRESPPPSSLW